MCAAEAEQQDDSDCQEIAASQREGGTNEGAY